MHVLCSTDKNYIMPAGVMIKSVSVNNPDADIVFHVIVDETVSKKFQKQLCEVVINNDRHVVDFLLFDETIFNTFPQIGEIKAHVTKATYYRLFVDRMLPVDIEKVLYLDCDVVVDNNLNKLFETDISNYAVGCVTDMSEAFHEYNRLGYDSKLGYFNAGVLLLNLKYWREHHVADDFMNIIINHPEKIKLHDQDVLNIVFCKNKLTLPLLYNVQNGFLWKPQYLQINYDKYQNELNDAIHDGAIIHFCSEIKPWHKDCDHPLREIWFKYFKETRWRNRRLKRKITRSLRTIIGDFLRKYHLRKSKYDEFYCPYVDL